MPNNIVGFMSYNASDSASCDSDEVCDKHYLNRENLKKNEESISRQSHDHAQGSQFFNSDQRILEWLDEVEKAVTRPINIGLFSAAKEESGIAQSAGKSDDVENVSASSKTFSL